MHALFSLTVLAGPSTPVASGNRFQDVQAAKNPLAYSNSRELAAVLVTS